MLKMNRRTFLGASAATAAMLSSGSLLSYAQWQEGNKSAPVEQIPTLCNGCENRCGLIAHVKAGRLWKVTGNPSHDMNKGAVCARGVGYAAYVYNPDRLTRPLKRNASGKLEPISWDQAFKEIGAKVQELSTKYGPQSIAMLTFPKPTSDYYWNRFLNAINSPNYTGHYTTCAASRNNAYTHTYGGVPSGDIGNAKYAVFMGRNPAEGIIPRQVQGLNKARANGAKVVVVDPRQSNTAIMADEWLAIKPGTDLALVLAWAHVLISENLYDKAFVDKYVHGFPAFADAVSKYTPEWAEALTGIPAKTVARVAREMAAAKPQAFIDPGWHGGTGAHYANSAQTVRAMACVNGLLGNLGKVGGIFFAPAVAFGDLDPAKHPAPKKSTLPRLDEAGVAGGKYPLALAGPGIQIRYPELAKAGKLKALFTYNHNIARTNPDRKFVLDGLKNLELAVVVDVQMSETAQEIAHYVLPESFYLERQELPEAVHGKVEQIVLRQPVIERVSAETKPIDEIIVGIAKASGVGQFFGFSFQELSEARLAKFGMKLEDLKKYGLINMGSPWKEGIPAKPDGSPGLSTSSGKIEFSKANWAANGFDAVPKWIPPRVTIKEGEFRLIHGHFGNHTHASTINVPHLLQISRDYQQERVWMNADRARALGIADGDTVVITSKLGEARGKVFVTERLHPEALFVPSSFGIYSAGQTGAVGFGIGMNDLTPHAVDPITGGAWEQEVALTVRKEGV